jgi:type IV pilus assembly protein PilB
VHGEDSVIRILDKESANAGVQEPEPRGARLRRRDEKKLRKFIREPYGMVLVTGPTGIGEDDDALRVSLRNQSVEDKIVTIEDPVEYQLRRDHSDSRSTRRRV